MKNKDGLESLNVFFECFSNVDEEEKREIVDGLFDYFFGNDREKREPISIRDFVFRVLGKKKILDDFPHCFFGKRYEAMSLEQKRFYITWLITEIKCSPNDFDKPPEALVILHEALAMLSDEARVAGFRIIQREQKKVLAQIFNNAFESIKENPQALESFLTLLELWSLTKGVLDESLFEDEDILELGKDVEITREELSKMLLDLLKANCQEYFNDLLQRKDISDVLVSIKSFLEELGLTIRDLNLSEDTLYKVERIIAKNEIIFPLSTLRFMVKNNETSLPLLGDFLPLYDYVKQKIEEYNFTPKELYYRLTEKDIQELDRFAEDLRQKEYKKE